MVPRIHLALNCEASVRLKFVQRTRTEAQETVNMMKRQIRPCLQSCPLLRLYIAGNIDKALQESAREFCQNDIALDIEGKSVTVPKIFIWGRFRSG